MELAYLQTLLAVVRHGSMTRAADELCLTQPAVSRRLRLLEERFGQTLLDRESPTLAATDAGKLVCEKAEELLIIERQLMDGLRKLASPLSVTFCTTPSFGISHLPDILRLFMAHHPDSTDLKFIFDTPERIVQGMLVGSFDLAVIEHCDCLDLKGLHQYPLPGDDMVFISAPSLKITTSTNELHELLPYPLLVRREGCCSRTLLEMNLRQQGKELRHFQRCISYDDIHGITKTVIAGEAIAFISHDVVRSEVAQGKLVAHYVKGFVHQRQRSLIFREHETLGDLKLLFIETIRNHFGANTELFSP